ncbi:HGL076Wp [Eremothecium sinecaudum]|uniref:RING-type E3 ubiquitin transferase n=1 Tax=Eremothecium sinecaudum TaxID=45286 RepID=A0A0X8HVI6_9SACH|nr:HGL076Wp [Eremothecium sinecaudum]AMD22264.1 HGL076Wp [Eremothecium sinecaudum]
MEIDGNTLIFVLVLLFIFFSNPGGDGVSSQYEYNQLQLLKSQFNYEYNVFHTMSSSSNFGNITGFRLSYADAKKDPSRDATYPVDGKLYDKWELNEHYMTLPDSVIEELRSNVWARDDVSMSFPPNITGSLHGHVKLMSNNAFTAIPMGIPNFYKAPKDFAQNNPLPGEYYLRSPEDMPKYGELHNVTFPTGKMDISFKHVDKASASWKKGAAKSRRFNTQEDKWKMLQLSLDFYDEAEREKHSIQARGIYDVQRGQILFMSQSAKFHSIFAFPHYMSIKGDEKRYGSLVQMIDEYWNASNYVETMTMDNLQDYFETANSKCEYIGYLQIKEWDKYTKDQIKMIDDELTWPIGRPVNMSDIPPIEISKGLLYSPDCGVQLSLDNVQGPRYEVQTRTIRKQLLVGCCLFAIQMYLFLLQMHHTNTPSYVNRICYWTIAMINLVDGLLAILYFLASTVLRELFLPLSVSSFACFILASIFETRYMISVYASQVNERGVSILTLLRGGGSDTRTPTTVIPDEAAISGMLYGRTVFTLLASMFIVISSLSWSKGIRTIFEYTCLIVLNSYWIPQIFRNAVKGNESRRARIRNTGQLNRNNNNMSPLLWKFIIGTTIIRMIPVVYVFTYPGNMFRHHSDPTFALILVIWSIVQVALLYSQDLFGARWFLPKHTIPEGYSYHKSMLSSDLLEHGSHENYSIDCAICMSEVAVYVEDIAETHKTNINEYMITPCTHVFHTECLENWMSYKLQCPVCRAPLPPL